jgi:hypothetical protein
MLFGRLIEHVHLLDLLQISVNISGVPFNKGKPTQDGRIEGGYSAGIEDHPHQVNLSIFC